MKFTFIYIRLLFKFFPSAADVKTYYRSRPDIANNSGLLTQKL